MSRANHHTDPLHLSIPSPHVGSKIALGLDLGSNTGYAFALVREGSDPSKVILPQHMGQWDLSAGPYESGAIRFLRLRQFLSVVRPDVIFYEEVKNNPAGIDNLPARAAIARASTAAELIGSFKATVCTWAEEFDIPCTGFSIGTIKKRATGHGNSGKKDMIEACNEAFGSNFEIEGYENTGVDNIADAAWILLLGLEQYGAGLTSQGEEDADRT